MGKFAKNICMRNEKNMSSQLELEKWFDVFDFTRSGNVSFRDLEEILKLMLIGIEKNQLVYITAKIAPDGLFTLDQVENIVNQAEAVKRRISALQLAGTLRLMSKNGTHVESEEIRRLKFALTANGVDEKALCRISPGGQGYIEDITLKMIEFSCLTMHQLLQ
jgi:hypothetical protein